MDAAEKTYERDKLLENATQRPQDKFPLRAELAGVDAAAECAAKLPNAGLAAGLAMGRLAW